MHPTAAEQLSPLQPMFLPALFHPRLGAPFDSGDSGERTMLRQVVATAVVALARIALPHAPQQPQRDDWHRNHSPHISQHD